MSLETVERWAPHDLDLEQAVLAGVTWQGTIVAEVAETGIRPQDFYNTRNAEIWEAVLRLVDDGRPLDVLTIADKAGQPLDSLLDLLDAKAARPNTPHIASRVVELAERRRIIQAARGVMTAASDGVDPAPAVDALTNVTARTGADATLSPRQLAEAACDYYDLLAAGDVSTWQTGIGPLDQLTDGVENTHLVTLAARARTGKTQFALQLAGGTLDRGGTVFMASVEMNRDELFKRWCLNREGLNLNRAAKRGFTDSETTAARRVTGWLNDVDWWVNDSPRMNANDVTREARRVAMRQGGLDLVVVDYVQRLAPVDPSGDRRHQLDLAVYSLAELAKELECPVLGLAQINRAGTEKFTPRMENIKETGAFEEASGQCWILHRPGLSDPSGPDDKDPLCELIVDKNKSGGSGKLDLCFWPHLGRFAPAAAEDGTPARTQHWKRDF